VADLIHEPRVQFPTATITYNGGVRLIGGILYVEDLCLISTDARGLQRMINTCQPCPQCKETTTKSPRSENVASVIAHPLHVPRLYQPHRETSAIRKICLHTTARGKTVRLLGAQTRPHDEYESCCGIHRGKGKQMPFSSPGCLLLPPLRQAPLQTYLLQFTC